MTDQLAPKRDKDLCELCTWSWIRETASGQIAKICTHDTPGTAIKAKILRCNQYQHKNEPSMYEMEKIAWIVTGDSREKVGFRPPKSSKNND